MIPSTTAPGCNLQTTTRNFLIFNKNVIILNYYTVIHLQNYFKQILRWKQENFRARGNSDHKLILQELIRNALKQVASNTQVKNRLIGIPPFESGDHRESKTYLFERAITNYSLIKALLQDRSLLNSFSSKLLRQRAANQEAETETVIRAAWMQAGIRS